MKYIMKNKLIYVSVGSLVISAFLISGTAFAQTNPPQGGWGHMGRMPGVFGTVSAVNGTMLTVTDTRSNTAYSVDVSNATVTKNGGASSLANVSVGDSVIAQGTVNGTSVIATALRDGMIGRGSGKAHGMMGRGPGNAPGVFGSVVSASGTTLTVTAKARPNGGPAVTYTIDASNATVTKNGASSSVSNIAVGDLVMVQGTVSGTSVTATSVRDGLPQGQILKQNSNPAIQGNGEPVIGGAVTSINGTTLTVTNKSNVTYTVDASNAKVEKGSAGSSLSSVAIGDNVLVQGAVNGTSVTASSVIDQGAAPTSANPSNSAPNAHRGFMGRVFGAVGGFFHGLFGFF